MYERMLDKKEVPTLDDMAKYCGNNKELFTLLNQCLSKNYKTIQKISFPYGNNYG